MARPRKDIDPEAVRQAIAHGNTVEDAAVILGVSKDTLERRFAADIEKGRAEMRSSLRKKQYELAMSGNTGMLVWLGKNLLGQADKLEHSGRDGGPVKTETEVKHTVDYDQLRRDLEKTSRGQVGGRVSENGNGKPVHPDHAN